MEQNTGHKKMRQKITKYKKMMEEEATDLIID
jgi:hypothetical protein